MEKLLTKKEATGSLGYMMILGMAIIMVITTLYMVQVAKLITHKYEVEDALTDSVLASLVADDEYYFSTYEMTGTPVVRFRDRNESFRIYKECMSAAVSNTEGFYYNFAFDEFILYEVEGQSVRITTYTGNGTVRTTSGTIGSVVTPEGTVVKETSAYGRVKFDIKSILDGSYLKKTKDIYCTIEIN